MANNRGERPLDLAAQYGRLQVVQMLIRAHPELLLPFNKDYDDEQFSDTDSGCSRTILTHSPLHLASRNGHKNVVEILLAAGVDVNLLTTSGTALHEAALCGKDTVVKALLDFGADLNVTDSEGRTALDLLKQFPPHVTKGIISVINSKSPSSITKWKPPPPNGSWFLLYFVCLQIIRIHLAASRKICWRFHETSRHRPICTDRLDRITANEICVRAIYGIPIAMSRPAVCSRVHRRRSTAWIRLRRVNGHRQQIPAVVEAST